VPKNNDTKEILEKLNKLKQSDLYITSKILRDSYID
jgi:hypothetical protein